MEISKFPVNETHAFYKVTTLAPFKIIFMKNVCIAAIHNTCILIL